MIWELPQTRISTIPTETISKSHPMLGLCTILWNYISFQSIDKSSFWNREQDTNWLIDTNCVKDKQCEN